ncbi:hypothetical protein [Siccirubricoccus phaeus]|uniref:hypothetical protein n=1 Tax=Siccirubricoccus phaeus TaxID=2595053 RepID=UPI0011F1C013|nr:hypothetical protein [Siccirubricoccus phaeus]
MRILLLPFALCAGLLAVPALPQAQTTTGSPGAGTARPLPSPPAPPPRSGDRSGSDASPSAPIDLGPRTPEANQAHRGGGAVLEGAPGAPAPAPQPTPPLNRPAPGR